LGTVNLSDGNLNAVDHLSQQKKLFVFFSKFLASKGCVADLLFHLQRVAADISATLLCVGSIFLLTSVSKGMPLQSE
jgi:hypothetical protein